MSKSKNWLRPNIKIIFNLFNGSKDTMITTVEIEVAPIRPQRGEAQLKLILALLKKILFPKHSIVEDKSLPPMI